MPDILYCLLPNDIAFPLLCLIAENCSCWCVGVLLLIVSKRKERKIKVLNMFCSYVHGVVLPPLFIVFLERPAVAIIIPGIFEIL